MIKGLRNQRSSISKIICNNFETLHISKSYQETTPYFETPQSLYLKYPRFSWFHRQLLSWNLLPIFQRNLLYARNNLNLDLIWLKIEKRNLILGKTNFQSCKENKIPTSWSLHVLKIMNWRKKVHILYISVSQNPC